jgi:hypothetical protein
MIVNIPIGLSFSYLKGSYSLLERLLQNKESAENLRLARIQLFNAVNTFQKILESELKDNSFLGRFFNKLSRVLIKDSYIMLDNVSLISFD